MFGTVSAWAGRTHRCRGETSRLNSLIAARVRATPPMLDPKGPMAAIRRRGRASGNHTKLLSSLDLLSSRGPARSLPTPSCTVIRRSVFSMGQATPRPWSKNRPGSGTRRWRSPITTGSTGWSGSPRLRGRSDSPRCSVPNSPSTSSTSPKPNQIPTAPICSCWPETPRDTPHWLVSSARRNWRARRVLPVSRCHRSTNGSCRAKKPTGRSSPVAGRARSLGRSNGKVRRPPVVCSTR